LIYDAIVVGLGPAGSEAARMLAKQGMRVLALEKDHMPRYKPCGGALSARVPQELGVDLTAIIQATIYGGVFTLRGTDQFSVRFHKPVAYMVMRPQFDQLLSQRAQCTGVCIHEGERVHTIRQRDTEVEVTTSRGVYRTAWLIGADGAMGTVRHHVTQANRVASIAGLEAEITTTQHVIQHYTQQVALDFGEMPNGYSWIFPKSDHLSVGIAGAFHQVARPRDYLRRFLNQHGLRASATDKIYGHIIPTFAGGRLHVQRQRILLIGDAAQLVDPFLGEGIYYAVKSAHIASHTLLECAHQPQIAGPQYEKRLHSLITELQAALKVARLLYRFPYYGYHLFKTHHILVQSYFKILCGENSFVKFYGALRRKAIANALPYGFRQRDLEYRKAAAGP
jgi:geranylgeranyl reductase family protein